MPRATLERSVAARAACAGARSRGARRTLRAGLRNQCGLSILEFTLVVSIVSVLVVYGAHRMMALRVDLERAAIEHTLAGMRSALALEFSTLVAQGKTKQIKSWTGGNPLELFETRNVFHAEAGAPPGLGEWAYDRERGEVVYRPAYPRALTGDAEAVGRWRVEVRGEGRPIGLELVTVEPLPSVGTTTQRTNS